jgi:hypothetical protein
MPCICYEFNYQFLQLFLTISVCSADVTCFMTAQEEYTRDENVTLYTAAGIFIYFCSFQRQVMVSSVVFYKICFM